MLITNYILYINTPSCRAGYIRVPRKKGKELVLKVFNSAVTALGCIVGEDGEMNVFAGSKDGVIKVNNYMSWANYLIIIGLIIIG